MTDSETKVNTQTNAQNSREDLDNLHSLKRISFKFINTKISSIINKIKNYKQITIVKNKYLKPIEISEIMNIKIRIIISRISMLGNELFY